MSIIAISSAIMNATRSQMSQPPHQQKQHQQQTIDTIQTTHMALFPIPATTFEILEGRFDFPAQTIVTQPPGTRGQIGNHYQGFFLIFVPIGAHIGFNLLLLPQTYWPIKPLARLAHQFRDGTGRLKSTVWRPMLTGMLRANTKHIMPPVFLAHAHHRKAAKSTIADHGTLRCANMRSQTVVQLLNTFP